MAAQTIHVSFEEFAGNVGGFLERVILARETVVVETDAGESVEVRPAQTGRRPVRSRRQRSHSAADGEAFLAAAGSWIDVDDADFLRKVYESRDLPPRRL